MRIEGIYANLRLGGKWLFPLHCVSFYKHVTLLGFVFAILLTSGYVYLCVNMCFNITEGINNSFRFINGNDAYELLYSYFGLNVDALHLVNGNSNGVILFLYRVTHMLYDFL